MPNPISETTRARLYVAGVIVGGLSVVVGPLILALNIPEAWAAVVISATGAVTALLATLARANLTSPDDTYTPQHAAEDVHIPYLDN